MISIYIWAFVIGCILSTIGLITLLLIIYGLIISAVKPIHLEGECDYEDDI